MANPNPRRENLKKHSRKEAAKNGAKGGVASGKSKREKKAMQELAKIVLRMPYDCDDSQLDDIERVCFEDFPDKHLTVSELSVLAVAKRAMKGDASALAFLRDTAGEKPMEKLEVSGNVELAAARIQELIARKKAGSDG